MSDFRIKMKDFGKKLRSKRLNILAVALLIAFILIVIYSYNTQKKYRQSIENNYNMAFFQLVDYVQDVEVYLAKSVISNSPESGAETLTYIWREANLAQTYLSMLPMNSVELENTAKFLNQVSDYSYSLSRKTINNTQLSQEDLDNLDKLHDYSLQLENTLNQLSLDINDGRITWGELTNKAAPAFAKQVSNISQDSFGSLEENFHEYAGLIYDGAYSEHMTNPERRGLTGDDIDEETAKNKVEEFISKDKIKKIESNGLTENANIQSYDFIITTINDEIIWISISQKGGHIISMNYNRDVTTEILSQEDIDKIAQNFLEEKGFKNMKKTYFTKRDGIETINFAYEQDNVIVYPDLIKVKIALDNGEILGIETTGYLNSHTQRTMSQIKVSKEDNQYNGDIKGTRLENAKFEVYDKENNLVDTLITDKNGEAITKELLKGKYTLKEVESPDYYILTDEIFEAEIVKHQEIVDVEIENDNVDIDIEVNKEGFKETQSKDTIYYDFSNIHNKSNIALDNFTWSDSLPTNALKANKIYTGTWNEDLKYSVWYKTNLSDDYIMLKDGLSTLVNNEVKFTDATLQEGEFITDFEFRFGTVKADFREVEQPRLYCDMLDNLPNGFIFVNHTKVSGNYKDIYVEDKDDWTTITYYKEIETTQKLPRTGC